MNFDDYENPIKSYVDDIYTYQLSSSLDKRIKIYVKQNNLELNDNFVQIGNSKDYQFLNVERTSLDVASISSDGERVRFSTSQSDLMKIEILTSE